MDIQLRMDKGWVSEQLSSPEILPRSKTKTLGTLEWPSQKSTQVTQHGDYRRLQSKNHRQGGLLLIFPSDTALSPNALQKAGTTVTGLPPSKGELSQEAPGPALGRRWLQEEKAGRLQLLRLHQDTAQQHSASCSGRTTPSCALPPSRLTAPLAGCHSPATAPGSSLSCSGGLIPVTGSALRCNLDAYCQGKDRKSSLKLGTLT